MKSRSVSHITLTTSLLKILSVALKYGSQCLSVTCFCHVLISSTCRSIISIKRDFCFISVGQACILQTFLSACFLFCNLGFFRPPNTKLLQNCGDDRCILFFINKTKCIIPYYFLNAGYIFFFLKMLGFKCYILIFCPESKTLLLDSLFKAKFYVIYIYLNWREKCSLTSRKRLPSHFISALKTVFCSFTICLKTDWP